MNKKVKAKTFTLVIIRHKTFGTVYALSGSRSASLCCSYVESYLGKTPRKIKVRVRATIAAGYTKAERGYYRDVITGRGWDRLHLVAAEAIDSVFGTRKTFYFKITEAKI